jgi:hypothetical protein
VLLLVYVHAVVLLSLCVEAVQRAEEDLRRNTPSLGRSAVDPVPSQVVTAVTLQRYNAAERE